MCYHKGADLLVSQKAQQPVTLRKKAVNLNLTKSQTSETLQLHEEGGIKNEYPLKMKTKISIQFVQNSMPLSETTQDNAGFSSIQHNYIGFRKGDVQ